MATCHPCWLVRLGPLSQLQEINYLCDPRHGGIRIEEQLHELTGDQLTLVGLFVVD